MRIVYYPHPALVHPTTPVRHIDRELRLAIGEMFERMYDAEGIGLAANQVALPYRLVVMNLDRATKGKESEEVYLNPTIVRRRGTIQDEEGCLSFPGLYAKVRRAKEVTVEAYDVKGQKRTIEAKDLAARAWQHEIDHLEGKVFIERFASLVRLAHHREIRSFETQFRRAQREGRIPPKIEIEKLLSDLCQRMEQSQGAV